MPISPQNGGIVISEWVFSQFLDLANFGLFSGRFSSLTVKKTKSAVLQPKMRSNQKVDEKKPALKFNFLFNINCAGLDV